MPSDDDSIIPFFPRRPKRQMPVALRRLSADAVIAEAADLGRDDHPVVPVDAPTLDLWSLSPHGGCPTLVGVDDLGLINAVEIESYSAERRWARLRGGRLIRLGKPAPLPLKTEG